MQAVTHRYEIYLQISSDDYLLQCDCVHFFLHSHSKIENKIFHHLSQTLNNSMQCFIQIKSVFSCQTLSVQLSKILEINILPQKKGTKKKRSWDNEICLNFKLACKQFLQFKKEIIRPPPIIRFYATAALN